MRKNQNTRLQKLLWWKKPLTVLTCVFLMLFLLGNFRVYAQQPSGSHVSSYNFTQGTPGFFEQAGVVAPFKTTLASGTAVFTSTTNAFLIPTGFSYTFNGTTYVGQGAGFTGNAFSINSNGWMAFNNNGTVNSISSLPAATTTPLSVTTIQTGNNGIIFSAMGRALVANAAGANGIANGSECYVVTYGDGRIVIEWRNMKPSSTTTGRIDYEIIVYPNNYLGNGLNASVEFRYANISFTGTASTAQVGLRGWQGVNDFQNRTTTTDWSLTTLGTIPTSNCALSATIFPATGTAFAYKPCTVNTAYAAVPYTQDFEASWGAYACGTGITNIAPGTNWKIGALNGNGSWRRNGEEATGNWSFLTDVTWLGSGKVVLGGSNGTGAATFHTYGAPSGHTGVMDLFIDLSGGSKIVTYDEFNATGADVVDVLVSTDGGATFGASLGTFASHSGWVNRSVTIPLGSATSVIRFRATSDFGNDDIGIDNISVTSSPTPPNCVVLVAPANGSSGQCPVIKWADGGGSASYNVYFGTTTPPPFVGNQTATSYVPVGGYVNGQLYYWQIVPQNVNGPAIGCPIYSYTAGALAQCYCTPTSTFGGTSGDNISSIVFADLNQAGGPIAPPGFADFTSTNVTMGQGSTYPATFTQGDPSDAIKVWIDFNSNGSFEDVGELVLTTGIGTAVSGNIAIPGTASIGSHRMRIRNAYTPNNPIAGVSSCSAVTYGETRDFTANITAPINDAAVTNLYSLGSLPQGYGDPHIVRARIFNSGGFTLTSLPVTLNITGANAFTDVQTIASLAPGASTLVSFSGFNPTALGTNTMAVTIPADDNMLNNGQSWSQDVTQNIYSYKNPAASNIGGVGFNGATGDFVGKFAASNNYGNSDTINEVQVDFFSNTGNQYQIGIWAADGVGGIPGTLLYTSPTYITAPGTQIKAIPNIVVSGDFYVGARQIGTVNIGFAYQSENPIRTQSFYFVSPSGGTAWNDFGSGNNPFRFAIQVRMEVPQIPLCPVGMLPANATTSCQNGTTLSWNTGGGGTTSYDVYFSTVQSDVDNQLPGALVSNNQAGTTYNTGALPAGQTYYWRVVGVNNYGESSGCSTQNFSTNLYSCYCAVASASGTFEHIGNVSYGAYSNTSSSSTFTSYTNLPAIGPVAKGQTFNLSVTVNNAYSTDVIHVYIDLNRDGDFGDANELAGSYTFTTGSGAAPQTVLVPVNVDASALSGETGMRIKMGDADPLTTVPVDNDPCQTAFSFGEVEDYRISIQCGVVTASANSPLCSGNDLNLTSAFSGVGTPTGYSWSGPNAYSSTQQNPTITGATTAETGTYTVTVTATGGCVATATASVIVNQSPDLSTSGGGVACAGNGITLSASNNAPGQTSGNTFVWTTDASIPFTSTQQTPTVTNNSLPGHSGNYTVVVTNSFLCTATTMETVTVNPNPTVALVSTQNVGCQGGSDGVITVSASNGTPAYNYSNDAFTTQNTSGIFTNLPVGPQTIDVQDDNGCTAHFVTPSLTFIHTVPPSASVVVPFVGMPSNVCNGTTASLSIPAVNNATMYIWDAPAGAYFNGNVLNVSPFSTNTPNVTVTYGNPSGSLYVTGVQAANGCGGSLRKVQKTRGTISVPASISGSLTKCENSSGTYSTAAVDAASSYLWTITGDASVVGTGTSVTVNFGPAWNGGTLCVSAQTTCYTSPSKCIAISKNASLLNAISGNFTACPNSVLSYSVPASTGAASYNWTAPAGASVTNGAGTSSVSVTYSPGYSAVGSICVSVTSICGVTSALKCKTVAPGLPTVPSSISGALTGLCNQAIAYSCPSQGVGTTYTWTAPAGTTINGQGSTSISAQYGSFSTGNLCVVANNACGSSAARCVPVKGAPNAAGAITANPTSWCAGDQVEFTVNTAALTGSYTKSWSYPAASVATYVIGGGNSSSLTLDWVTGSGNVNVSTTNACGTATKTSTWSNTCRQGEVARINTLNVSPNPTTGILYVSYTATKGNTLISVLDLAGRVVMTQATNSIEGANNTQLDMSKLSKGAYLLKIQSTQGDKQAKVVVE